MKWPHWLFAVLIAAIIVYLSHRSSPPGESLVAWFGDKSMHFVEYLVFGIALVWGASAGSFGPLDFRSAIFLVAAASLFALSDEFHQSFVPGRHADVSDWAVDTLGAATAALAAYLRRPRQTSA